LEGTREEVEKVSKEIAIKSVAAYNGHSIRNNKSVNLGLVFVYGELPNYIKLIQLLNENIEIIVKIEAQKSFSLGSFMLNEFKIDHDGQGIMKFNGMLDYVESDNLNCLVGQLFKVRFKATVDDVSDVEGEDE